MSKARQEKKNSANRNNEVLDETVDGEIIDENLAAEEQQEATASDNAAPADDAAEEKELELSPEEQLTLERDVFHDKWMRAVAETDNVRKRARKEVNDSRRFAQAETLRAFLDLYDNFERALQLMGETDEEKEAGGLREGVELIFQKFQAALKDRGTVKIEAQDCEFDPSLHEAVGQLPREGVEAGMVIEVVQQGFKYGDMVLRPARVIVSS